MKWIKTSERLPNKVGDYHTKINMSTHIENSCTDFNGQEFDDPNVIEWLDESPSESDAVEQEKAIKYLSWYIQSGYEAENIEGTVFTPGDDPEKKISADELYQLFIEQNK